MRLAIGMGVALLLGGAAAAQLPPVPEPAENPITEPKRLLGKILFWDEQLSSDDTVACGTCHDPAHAGADARIGVHPGLDGAVGTGDDIVGSPGVALADADGVPVASPQFGFEPQVTRRAANPVIGAAFAPELFWDGRAGLTFRDPETGQVSIAGGGALENQAAIPIVSPVEMARASRTWADVTSKLTSVEPLRFAADLPADVEAALAAGADYPALFDDAFGDPVITAERIAFAIATYERTLVDDDTPWDRFFNGDDTAMTPDQQQGWFFFQGAACSVCHFPPFFTNHAYRNIGVRPVAEDSGREKITGVFADRGRFKVPTLRNVGLKRTFMHNGRQSTLDEVITFYQPGNQFPENLDPLMPVPVPPDQRLPLLDFLQNGLTDPRVAAATFPFDRPSLFAGRDPRELLFFSADRMTVSWPDPPGADEFRVYRGDLAALVDADDDGLPDAGYGACMSAVDPDPTDAVFVDVEQPVPGAGFFYLRSIVDAGGEGGLGATSAGAPRVPGVACP